MKVIKKPKSNFQIRVWNTVTGKTATKSYIIEGADETQIMNKIDKCLSKN